MAFDATYLGAVLEEIRALGDARVEKIHQPGRDAVILHLRGRETRAKLLISPNPAAPRLHLTEANPENPAQPPMFCMLLRKHLLSARLCAVEQLPMERCAIFTFDCIDDFGDPTQKRLVAELMGRTCNLYLVDSAGRILDCLRRIGLDESNRPALPGLLYQPPAPVEKIDPKTAVAEDYVNLLNKNGPDLLADRLMDGFGGLSPLVCREAALYAAGATDARLEGQAILPLAEKLQLFFREHLSHPRPCYTDKQYTFCPLRQYGDYAEDVSFSGLLDRFYTLRDQRDTMRQKSQTVRKTVTSACQRLSRKLAIQEKELAATQDRERLRQLGDILTANLHRVQKGQTQVTVEDFYDENMASIQIPLSPTLSPQQNAAKFYKDYARMKTAEKELTHQMALAQQERSYLQSVLEELDRAASEAELEEIRQELRQSGYLKPDPKSRMKQNKLAPMRFESTDGYPILVGRNNRQNEELTFKSARKDDLWLHASKVHGAHVIILCGGTTPPDDTVTQAAQLAAHYSEAKGSQNISVDVTAVKQVKKIPGGKPGMVIYHTYRTVVANPYPDIVMDPLNAEQK